MGTKIYSISELQPGDLVFFNDPSRNKGKACSHAGIYIGNGQMVEATVPGRLSQISPVRGGATYVRY